MAIFSMIVNMTEGKPSRILLAFTLPMILGNIFQQFYNIVDSVVVGRFVGTDALAAVGAAGPIVFLMVAVALGLTMGCSVVISQLFGAGNIPQMKRAVYTAFVFLGLVAVAITALGLGLVHFLLRITNTPGNVFQDAAAYLYIYCGGLLFVFAYNAFSALFRSLGDSRTPLVFLIIATVVNIILDYIFVVYFHWDVPGVAWATLIAQAVSAILCVIHIMRNVPVLQLTWEDMVFDRQLLSTMLRFAVPSCIQQFAVSFGMMAVQGLVNSYGSVVMAAYNVATKIDSLAMLPTLNLSIGLSTFTAQNIGAQKPERVPQGYRTTLLLTAFFALLVTFVVYTFGPHIVAMFVNPDQDPAIRALTVETAVHYIKVVSPFYLLMGLLFAGNGVLRGAGDMSFFLGITIFNLSIRVLAAYVLANFLGYSAIWWSIPVGWGLAALVSNLRYLSGKWKTKGVKADVLAD